MTATTAGGTSATNVHDGFTYVTAPTVTGVSPSSGPVAGGTSVTITGTNLLGTTTVDFGSVPADESTVTVDPSGASLTVTSPAGTAGTVDVTVTTPGGTSALSTVDQFTYGS